MAKLAPAWLPRELRCLGLICLLLLPCLWEISDIRGGTSSISSEEIWVASRALEESAVLWLLLAAPFRHRSPHAIQNGERLLFSEHRALRVLFFLGCEDVGVSEKHDGLVAGVLVVVGVG